jgi:hypothetical protein
LLLASCLYIHQKLIVEELKLEYVKVIKKEANLEYWCGISIFTNRSIINTIFEKAKLDSKKRV